MADSHESGEFTIFNEKGQPFTTPSPPKAGSGVVWVRGVYSGNTVPSPFDMRVGSGMHAWFLIMELDHARGDFESVLAQREGEITEEDIEAAIHHYFRYKEEIDAKIQAQYAPVV